MFDIFLSILEADVMSPYDDLIFTKMDSLLLFVMDNTYYS